MPDILAGTVIVTGDDDPAQAGLFGIVHGVLNGLGVVFSPKLLVACVNLFHSYFSLLACMKAAQDQLS